MSGPTYTQVIRECFRRPSEDSYWDPMRRQFVCPGEAKKRADVDEGGNLRLDGHELKLALRDNFKLVLYACLALTALFTTLCYGLAIYYEGKPPELIESLIKSAGDIMKIGAGAITGMVGAAYVNTRG